MPATAALSGVAAVAGPVLVAAQIVGVVHCRCPLILPSSVVVLAVVASATHLLLSVGAASPSIAASVGVAAVQQADHAADVRLVSVVPATAALGGVTVVAGSV